MVKQMVNGAEVDFGGFADGSDADSDRRLIFFEGGLSDQTQDCS
jgi:hypothetical protein